jgi:acyl-CoA thioesterase YciA
MSALLSISPQRKPEMNSDIAQPKGKLTLRVIATDKDTNSHGDIYAGWLVAQMDLATSSIASQIAKGRTTTVSIKQLDFISPVRVGAEVSCYTRLADIGTTSIRIEVEVWTRDIFKKQQRKASEGIVVFVAIDALGRIREVPEQKVQR